MLDDKPEIVIGEGVDLTLVLLVQTHLMEAEILPDGAVLGHPRQEVVQPPGTTRGRTPCRAGIHNAICV